MAYSGKDYLGDKRLSQELADKIYSHWIKTCLLYTSPSPRD